VKVAVARRRPGALGGPADLLSVYGAGDRWQAAPALSRIPPIRS